MLHYTETPLNIIGIATSCKVFDANPLIGQSEPVDIYLCDTTSGGGGDPSSITSALSLLTNIIPNPASTFATVYSSFQLTALEAYDLRGNKVLDTKASGTSATIDIADWPSGMYIVIVHTPAGNVAKKLVVN